MNLQGEKEFSEKTKGESERYRAKNEIRFLVSNSASLQTVKLKYTVKLAIKHKSLFEYILKVEILFNYSYTICLPKG